MSDYYGDDYDRFPDTPRWIDWLEAWAALIDGACEVVTLCYWSPKLQYRAINAWSRSWLEAKL